MNLCNLIWGKNMASREIQNKRTVIYEGKVIRVYCDDITIVDSGILAKREIINHYGGVTAILRTHENKIKFVKQYRYAFSEELLELPAGKIEKGEDPDYTIVRELEEEVGCRANKIEKIGVFYPTPGYSNEIIHLYYCDDYEECNHHFDVDEDLDEFEYTYEEALKMIECGEIVDGKSICLLLRCKDKFLK